jgi:hypothetical protein
MLMTATGKSVSPKGQEEAGGDGLKGEAGLGQGGLESNSLLSVGQALSKGLKQKQNQVTGRSQRGHVK